MASKKFAHRNSFPFMTAPKVKHYSAQLQSPLFRLPREIRDVIYDYCDDGYHYDSETGRMLYRSPLTTPQQVIRLGLILTCRIAAEELRHRVFQEVHFRTHSSFNDGHDYMGVRSRAGRFRCLLMYAERQKCRMLIRVFELLQQVDFAGLYTHFPSVRDWFDAPLRRSVALQDDELVFSQGYAEEIESQAFGDALQYALELAKNRNPSEFARLTGETFGYGLCPVRVHGHDVQNNIFVESALHDIFTWNLTPWSIPSNNELAKLESLVCLPGHADYQLLVAYAGLFWYAEMKTHSDAANTRWYFSAASVAIDFRE